ncbi:EF hand [Enhydrobacter aerosaccus]|uniref:EF hand n=1 Tax=Enhydrobacter aerosaccus TaxID=225324 RepID=A0A1T4S231_9HYPH|nr:EF-hand domain-containing protein [Enhydrobacter aerosaccus]SKA21988.1 EF hand [Enhydrobacter aerosaccus]
MPKFIPIAAAALLLAMPALAAPDNQPSARTSPNGQATGVMRYDANGDGVVDRTEWETGQDTRFKQLDTNKDGRLSRDELFARAPSTDGNVLPSDRQVQRQAAYFQRLDTDKDGYVSKAEFMSQATRNFARCDLNKDGRIDTAECRQALRRRPAQAQPASVDR